MKIVHICQYFQEEMSYQENLLPKFQANQGHEVIVIVSDREYKFNNNINRRIVGCKEIRQHNYKVIRLPIYLESINKFVIFKQLGDKLNELKPDLIYHHGLTAPSIFTCINYKKKNKCFLKVDCHSDINNSMHGFRGEIYHKVFWRQILKRIQRYFDGIDYIAPSCLDFLKNIYKLDDELYNFTILGGDSSFIKESLEHRQNIRKNYNIQEDEIVLIHCGKMDMHKRTKELLMTFNQLRNPKIRLMIIGSIDKNYEKNISCYLEDSRIIFVGWKNSYEMLKHFCSGDILVQPGSLSAVFQNAMCCGIPVILDKTSMGEYLTNNDSGILVDGKSIESIKEGILKFIKNPNYYKKNCIEYAIPKLKYEEIAKKSLKIMREY